MSKSIELPSYWHVSNTSHYFFGEPLQVLEYCKTHNIKKCVNIDCDVRVVDLERIEMNDVSSINFKVSNSLDFLSSLRYSKYMEGFIFVIRHADDKIIRCQLITDINNLETEYHDLYEIFLEKSDDISRGACIRSEKYTLFRPSGIYTYDHVQSSRSKLNADLFKLKENGVKQFLATSSSMLTKLGEPCINKSLERFNSYCSTNVLFSLGGNMPIAHPLFNDIINKYDEYLLSTFIAHCSLTDMRYKVISICSGVIHIIGDSSKFITEYWEKTDINMICNQKSKTIPLSDGSISYDIGLMD